MDYLCSSAPSLLPSEDRDHRETVVTPPPTLVDSSCSELSELSFQEQPPRELTSQIVIPKTGLPIAIPLPVTKAGETSPSSIIGRRKLSTAITTTPDAKLKHPVVLEGRPTVVLPLPKLEHKNNNNSIEFCTPKKSTCKNNTMAIPRSAPPRAPRSGPPRPDRKDRSITNNAAAVAPAPLPVSVEATTSTSTSNTSIPKPRFLHRAQSLPVFHDLSYKLRMEPAPLRLDAWSEPAAENFNVRGPNYMKNRAKNPSHPAAFRLLTVDLVNCENPIYGGLCAHPSERVQQALKRERETGVKELPPFVFAVNLIVPGPGSVTYHQVAYFAVDNMKEIEEGTSPFGRLMNKFIFGDSDDFRNKTFKLIPRIVEGNYIVRKAVGSKPSILGRKIKQYYVRGERYFEIIVDIASDVVAQRIVKLALGYAKTLVVDMMYLLEGTHELLLPERIFGGVRMKNVDFRNRDGKRSVAS